MRGTIYQLAADPDVKRALEKRGLALALPPAAPAVEKPARRKTAAQLEREMVRLERLAAETRIRQTYHRESRAVLLDRIAETQDAIIDARRARGPWDRDMEEALRDLLPLISLPTLRGRRRTARIARLRFKAYFLLRQAGFTVAEIARFLCRDHGAVCHGLKGYAGLKEQP